jgi:hypothetical protein
VCSWNLLHNKKADYSAVSQSLADVKLWRKNVLRFIHIQSFQDFYPINKSWDQAAKIPGFHEKPIHKSHTSLGWLIFFFALASVFSSVKVQ